MTTTTYTDLERVGLIVVPWEVVATEELPRFFPDGVTYVHDRAVFEEEDTPEATGAALSAYRAAVTNLLPARPSAIALACTSGGVFAGGAWHRLLLEHLARWAGGVPTTTAAGAVARVITDMGYERIAIGTPYTDPVVAGLRQVLDETGVDVVAAEKLFPDGPPDDPWPLMTTTPREMFEFALKVDSPDADAVFLSCTGLHSTPVIDAIEAHIKKPLITSNIALSHFFSTALRSVPAAGLGSIMRDARSAALRRPAPEAAV